MASELVVRFLLGGIIVSLFAAAGELFTPKTFAGLFAAAPSVALATLGLAFASSGAAFAATEARSMLVASVALFVYSAMCVVITRHKVVPMWVGVVLAWASWFAVALGAWTLL